MANKSVDDLADDLRDALTDDGDKGLQVPQSRDPEDKFLKVSNNVHGLVKNAVKETIDALGPATVTEADREKIRQDILASPEHRTHIEQMTQDVVAAATAVSDQRRDDILSNSGAPGDTRSVESLAGESYGYLRGTVGKKRQVDLYDVMAHLQSTRTVGNDLLEQWREAGENVGMCNTILESAGQGNAWRPFGGARTIRDLDCWPAYEKLHGSVMQEVSRAMSTEATGAGAEFIPSILTSNLDDRIRVVPKVFDRHPSFQMSDKVITNPFNLSGLTFYIAEEATAEDAAAIRASTLGTADTTWTARTYAVRSVLSMEMDEDSVIQMMPLLRSEIARAEDDMLENSYINAEFESAPADHFDGSVTAVDDVRLGFDGYRAAAFDNSTGDNRVNLAGGTIEANQILAVRKGMAQYGTQLDRLHMVVSFSGLSHLWGIDQVETMDKFGAEATIKTGTIVQIYGMPVFTSQFLVDTMTAAGADTGSGSFTSFLIVWNGAFIRGQRRGLEISAIWNPETLQRTMVGFERFDVQTPHTPATNPVVGMGFNVTTNARS